MPNLKLDFSRQICTNDHSSSRAIARWRTPSLWPYVPKPARRDIGALVDVHQQLTKFIDLIKAALCES